MPTNRSTQRGEVLVAIINNLRDFAILQEQLWYRIPVATAPKRWPPRWLAFYQTKVFEDDRWAVNYYGPVRSIRIRRGQELGLYEPPHPKSGRRYYQVFLHSLERLANPIPSRRWRRIVFIPTTWPKFAAAAEVNDLFDESPLEDQLWDELQRLDIPAERKWDVQIGRAWYKLDFALFCQKGPLALETDGWQVMRFTGRQIREQMPDYCIPKITEMINRLDGLTDDGLVPRTFHQATAGLAQQLALFEDDPESNDDTEYPDVTHL